ncbi:MAG TPA: hypothetical protein VKF82_02470 [Candidatus Eremiobacteraceae bacterium]|nr:hypothetical protein [Candidatus Eremiobacteraceae bacterium]
MTPKIAGIAVAAAIAFAVGCAGSGGVSGLPPINSGGSTPTPVPTGKVALNDLGAGTYLGFEGGLYPNGANNPPPAQDTAGMSHAAAVRPLDASGNPSASGKIVLLSIGMSNTTDEWCGGGDAAPCVASTFTALAQSGGLNKALVIADGALGGQAAPSWLNPFSPPAPCLSPQVDGYCTNYDRVANVVLPPLGVTEKQVQVIWLKEADENPTISLPSSSADAYTLEANLGHIVRAAKQRYPDLRMIFLSSRTYGGYATTSLNPEPYAYESAFAVKWLIQAQINQMQNGTVDPIAGDLNYNNGTAPWLGWAAYLWANGTTARSDGLIWCNGQAGPPCNGEQDYQSDGTHPLNPVGTAKVGDQLLNFFKTSPYTASWFL